MMPVLSVRGLKVSPRDLVAAALDPVGGLLGQEQSNGVLAPGVDGGVQGCPAVGVARGGCSLGCQQARHLLREALSGGEVQGGLTGKVGDGWRHARLKPERGERQPIR